ARGEPHSCHLPQGRVRLLGRVGEHTRAHASALGRALQRGGLGLPRLGLSSLADELLDGGHRSPRLTARQVGGILDWANRGRAVVMGRATSGRRDRIAGGGGSHASEPTAFPTGHEPAASPSSGPPSTAEESSGTTAKPLSATPAATS